MQLWKSQVWIFFTKPLSWIYQAGVAVRYTLYQKGIFRSHSLSVKVISVGNITVGGTGKTPLVCMIARMLQKEDYRIGILSRGYGRADKSIRVVSDGTSIKANCQDAGDEPYFMAQKLPGVSITVSADRYQAGETALSSQKRDVFILDDGFQHWRLNRDFNIVTMDSKNPWGNGHLLPSGPLREPLKSLKRASVIVLTGPQENQNAAQVIPIIQKYTSAPVFQSYHRPIHWINLKTQKTHPLEFLKGKQAVAFAGIGKPEAFQSTLKSLNVIVRDFITFCDHHWYSEKDLQTIQKKSIALGVDAIVTTEKDAVRLNHLPPKILPIFTLSIELTLLGDADRFRQHLLSVFHS